MEVTRFKTTKYNKGRSGNPIERITPHCMAGQMKAVDCCQMWINEGRDTSANYIIGRDGEIVYEVDEVDRAWTSSSKANDDLAITIECASDATYPYAFNDKVYNSLIDLMCDIITRNGRKRLKYIPDKDAALAYKVPADEMLITFHRWFDKRKECPGDWLINKMPDLVTKVNERLNPQGDHIGWYKVQVGAFKDKANAEKLLEDLYQKGYEGIIVKCD